MRVRRLLHALGYRFRLHRDGLPGKPDIVFPGHRKVILVHGCFWHAHDCAVGNRTIKTRGSFWAAKFARNKERDAKVERALLDLGWGVLTIWECQTLDRDALALGLVDYLGPSSRSTLDRPGASSKRTESERTAAAVAR